MFFMAGNRPHVEEVVRALFAEDRGRFSERIESSPIDVRDRAKELATDAFMHQKPDEDT